jgi:hypothetical protein
MTLIRQDLGLYDFTVAKDVNLSSRILIEILAAKHLCSLYCSKSPKAGWVVLTAINYSEIEAKLI